LKTGQVVRVISGPFKNFEGTVEEINQEKGTVKGFGLHVWPGNTG